MIPATRPSGHLDFDILRRFFDDAGGDPQVRRARIGWAEDTGTSHLTLTAGQDVDVHVTTAAGFPLTARLFAPGGLWALPPLGDECLVLAQEGDAATPGAPVCLWRHRLPPAHLTPTNAVLEIPADGLLVGDGAAKAAARTDDPILPGTLALSAVATVLPVPPGVVITLTYTPPGGTPQVSTVTLAGAVTGAAAGSITLGGKIGDGSAKVKIE